MLYVGTFSKVLFPGLRLGYLVAPEALVQDFTQMATALQPDRSYLVQSIVAEFMREGHFARHIRRMRTLYAERRLALAKALAAVFPKRFAIELEAGGMHLLARLDERESDQYLVREARAHGLGPEALSLMATESRGQGLLLSFTNIPADEAMAQARCLEQAIGSKPARRRAAASTE